jgi:hypothetical protein
MSEEQRPLSAVVLGLEHVLSSVLTRSVHKLPDGVFEVAITQGWASFLEEGWEV